MKNIYLLILVSVLAFGLAGCGSESSDRRIAQAVSQLIAELRIEPSQTGAGITPAPADRDYHQVLIPASPSQRKNIMILYMTGSSAAVNGARDISYFAAGLGYGVLNIKYPNEVVVGIACGGDNPCYGRFRGESLYGANQAYQQGHPTYDEPKNFVDTANSIINRMLSLLDYLANLEASENHPDPAYWRQFYYRDPNSPYVTTHSGPVYPDWSKIVPAGHSQGGGMAAMLGSSLPVPVRRLIMFSAPNDNSGPPNNSSAPWIAQAATTPLENWWGLRHIDDGQGTQVPMNWSNFGGAGSGGVGGPLNNGEADVGDGSGDPAGTQRLLLTAPLNGSETHLSTVRLTLPNVVHAWEYLFTAGGTD